MIDDISLNKAAIIRRCLHRIAEEYRDDPSRLDDFTIQDSIVLNILRACEASLRRLQTDHIDLYQIHAWDPITRPDEVAAAFAQLKREGKVRWFGVSNHTAGQIELLSSVLDQPLVINQVELSLLHHHLINEGVIANRDEPGSPGAEGTLDYCRRRNILVQAWAPVAGGRLFDPPGDAAAPVRAAAHLVSAMAERKATTREAVVLAWLLRHPAPIQPLIGTVQPGRIAASALADAIELTREEWYALFVAGRGTRMP